LPCHSLRACRTAPGVFAGIAFVLFAFDGHAGIVINPLSWGLNPGDTFRLVVVTASGTTGTSTSISTYDTFVNTQGLSGITVNGASLTWQAIGLTPSSNPLTDTTRYSSQANASRTYNLNGALVSNTTNGSAFWKTSGYNQHLAAIDWTINGSGNAAQVNGSQAVWTGFDIDGTVASATDYDEFGSQIGTVTAALGQSIEYRGYDYIYDPETEDYIEVLATKTLYPYLGRAGALANGWAAFDNLDPTTVRPMYAMSELITVTAVPEPSTYAMAIAGLACGGYSMWRSRKRA
jgi:hypothetical protein